MDFWIHVGVFTVVFLVTGIILSVRKKRRSKSEDSFNRLQVHGEIRKIDSLKRKEVKKK